jgi:hypothetical protein
VCGSCGAQRTVRPLLTACPAHAQPDHRHRHPKLPLGDGCRSPVPLLLEGVEGNELTAEDAQEYHQAQIALRNRDGRSALPYKAFKARLLPTKTVDFCCEGSFRELHEPVAVPEMLSVRAFVESRVRCFRQLSELARSGPVPLDSRLTIQPR